MPSTRLGATKNGNPTPAVAKDRNFCLAPAIVAMMLWRKTNREMHSICIAFRPDAAAICEPVTRPSMRFAGVRSLENQAALMRHKAREMLVSQRTQLLNGLLRHLTEIGVIAAQGPRQARELAELIQACDETIPFEVCEALATLVVQLRPAEARRHLCGCPTKYSFPKRKSRPERTA